MTGPLLDVLVAFVAHLVVLAAVAGPKRAQRIARGWLDGLLDVIQRCGVTDDAEAREIAHDTLADVWRGIATGRFHAFPRVDRAAVLQGYIYGAAWRIATRRVDRRRVRRRRELPAEDAPEPARDPTPQLEARDAVALVMVRATERDAAILAARSLGDSHVEVAAAVGVTPSHAQQLCRDAQAAAAKILADSGRQRFRWRRVGPR